MRKLCWFAYFWIYIVLTVPWLLVVLCLDKLDRTEQRDRIAQRFLQNLGRRMVRLTGSTIKVSGLENIPKTPVVFVSNHQSHFDSAVILGYIPKPAGFIAAIEASRFPIWSVWFRYGPAVFMQRDNLRQSLKAINEGIDLLKEGYSMVIYPEGTISKKPTMGAFKRGSLRLATSPGVPIVPVAIKDTYRIMGEDNTLIQAAAIELTVFPPIVTKGLSKAELEELPTKLQAMINRCLTS